MRKISKHKPANQKTDTWFFIFLVSGLIIAGAALSGGVPFDVSGTYTSGDQTLHAEFTGIHATILTVGLLIILAAFLFKYKKLPGFT